MRFSLLAIFLTACVSAHTPPPAPLDQFPYLSIQDYRKVTFKWEFEGDEMVARGDGIVRIAPPDSARLDFFLAGGFGAGGAVLIADSLSLPQSAMAGSMREMLPPTQFLWENLKKIVTRAPEQKVFNVNYGSTFDRRKLKLIIVNDETSLPFSSNIWRF